MRRITLGLCAALGEHFGAHILEYYKSHNAVIVRLIYYFWKNMRMADMASPEIIFLIRKVIYPSGTGPGKNSRLHISVNQNPSQWKFNSSLFFRRSGWDIVLNGSIVIFSYTESEEIFLSISDFMVHTASVIFKFYRHMCC